MTSSATQEDHQPREKSAPAGGDKTMADDDGGRSGIHGKGKDDAHYFYYSRIDDAGARRYSYPSHVLETLVGEGLIERYHVYERRPYNCCGEPLSSASGEDIQASDAPVDRTRGRQRGHEDDEEEVVVGDVRFGGNLDGHPGVVHGGITSLVFDDLMGHACDVLRGRGSFDDGGTTTCVTANLSVNFRSPLPSGSDVVVRVYHQSGKSRGGKVHLRAAMSTCDGSVLFSDATSLYVKVRAAAAKKVDSETTTNTGTSASGETSVSSTTDGSETTTATSASYIAGGGELAN